VETKERIGVSVFDSTEMKDVEVKFGKSEAPA
jgi:hypothetical protein